MENNKFEIHNLDSEEQEVSEFKIAAFPLIVTDQAIEYVERKEKSQFKISEIVAKQAGIHDLNEKGLEKHLEEKVSKRLEKYKKEVYQEAYEQGLKEGQEKAFKENDERLKESIGNIEDVFKFIDEQKTKVLKENEVHIINLIKLISEKIILRELKGDSEIIGKVMNEVLSIVDDEEKVTIKLSSVDYRFVQSSHFKDKSMFSSRKVELIEDESLKPSACIVETEHGLIDASLEQRLEQVWSAIDKNKPRLEQS